MLIELSLCLRFYLNRVIDLNYKTLIYKEKMSEENKKIVHSNNGNGSNGSNNPNHGHVAKAGAN